MATNTYTISYESIATIREGLTLLHGKYCRKLVQRLEELPEGDLAVQIIRNKLNDIDYMIGLFDKEG